MKKKLKSLLLSLFITLPLTFVLLFFGLLPPRFDAVIYVDNIVGEGSCTSYLSDVSKPFSSLYEGDAYFGSELKTLRLTDLQYNVKEVGLYMYGIEQVDIISYDVSMFGLVVAHVNKDGLTHPFTVSKREASSTNEAVLYHFDVQNPDQGVSMGFPGNYIIPTGLWIVYFAIILLTALLLAVGLSLLMEHVPAVELPLLTASCLMLTMIVGCIICDSLPYVSYIYFMLNWLLFFAAAILINALTLPWIGTVFVSVFSLCWYIANYFVIQFRNKPIMPADLKALGTAKEVVGGYDLSPTWQMVLGVLLVAGALTLFVIIYRKSRPAEKPPIKKRLIRRGIGALAGVLLILFGVNNSAFAQVNDFQWDMWLLEGFHREGILLTYVKSAVSGHVSKPEGYSKEAVDAFLAQYTPETDSGAVHPTRIIMIMNEAFSDLRTVGLDDRIDVMPFIDSLDDNTIEGSLFVSIIGGGTCNTEFEALTGNTLAFLATGAYPYTENVTEPRFSLASYFRDNGYLTEAFHAGISTSWNRNTVYPNLGFDVFHSYENYPNLTENSFMHRYITDATDYDLMTQRDKANQGSPRFFFNVTIQNHAPYNHYEDVPRAETVAPFEDLLPQDVKVYLSMVKVSDDSLRQFMTQYMNSDEPTMIIFFGDHEPSLPDATVNDVYRSMQGNLDFFKTKFFIWTNYETQTVHQAAVSANYLPLLILERGNFPLPPYLQMLKELREKYPILSSQGVVDSDGFLYDNVAVLADDPLIQKYQYIQYANLFDELDPAWFQVKTK